MAALAEPCDFRVGVLGDGHRNSPLGKRDCSTDGLQRCGRTARMLRRSWLIRWPELLLGFVLSGERFGFSNLNHVAVPVHFAVRDFFGVE